jgi:hypothetical protein
MARPREYEDKYEAVMHLLSLGRTVREIGHVMQIGKSTIQRMKNRGCALISAAGDLAVAVAKEDRDAH